ncbi:hypothetical protein L915_12303 [Phytophthora nicotianae]|uniref:Uncharacterized protein n=1 Tax=Phytophthora nicotianae TaxID=4792 RepID=W2GJ18_PHYNI|nr:hypothetical protein L915_12303 [Phytophthora nicotianae]
MSRDGAAFFARVAAVEQESQTQGWSRGLEWNTGVLGRLLRLALVSHQYGRVTCEHVLSSKALGDGAAEAGGCGMKRRDLTKGPVPILEHCKKRTGSWSVIASRGGTCDCNHLGTEGALGALLQ